MKLDRLKEFIEFMEENDLSELEIEEEGQRIRLKKFSHQTPAIIQNSPIMPHAKEEKEQQKSNLIEIKSPMVGTFYRAPSPGAKPYIELGDVISPGDVVCIVEAMKLMNEIKTETGGKIVEILVDNADPVEFGQVLFLMEPV